MNLTLNEHTYVTTNKLDIMTQFHVARKLGPALSALEGLVNPDTLQAETDLLLLLIMSKLPDEDAEYVTRKCLGNVFRLQGNTKAKIMDGKGGLMFEDINLEDIMRLTVTVINESLGDFFRTALGNLATLT